MLRRALFLTAALCAVHAGSLRGQHVLTQDEALRAAFPAPLQVIRRSAFLTASQRADAATLARQPVADLPGVVTYYAGVSDGGKEAGIAYFDAHTVRTRREVVMVVVVPGDTISRIEVLAFDEPSQYRPRDRWLGQFTGVSLHSASPPVRRMTGATLTSLAIELAVQRILALHAVVAPFGASQ